MPGLTGAGLQRQVSLSRPDGSVWSFQIQPLRLGFQRRLRLLGIAPPSRPTRVARDSHGKPLKDAQGLAVLMADEVDAEYLQAVELYQQRVAGLMLAEGLSGDPEIQFESPVPMGNSGWDVYADALHEELDAAGFRPGELAWLCDEICRLSGLMPEQVQETSGVFSRRPRPRTEGAADGRTDVVVLDVAGS